VRAFTQDSIDAEVRNENHSYDRAVLFQVERPTGKESHLRQIGLKTSRQPANHLESSGTDIEG